MNHLACYYVPFGYFYYHYLKIYQMNNKRILINMDTIGLVLFEKSAKAKNIIISIKPQNNIRVAVPMNTSFKDAKKFLMTKKTWITNHINKISNVICNKIKLESVNIEHARKPLEERVNQLAKQYNFSFNKLFIKNQKTRWGSCSEKNNINLNARLLHLPQELIDYVILHELVHTKIKNHSKEFWTKLDEYIGNSKFHNNELKKYIIK